MKSSPLKNSRIFSTAGIFSILLCCILSSCKNDKLISEYIPAQTIPTVISNANVLKELHEKYSSPSTSVTFNAMDFGYITGPKGVQVSIPANALLLPNGLAPTSPVNIVLKEILTPGEMIMNNKPTVGQNGELLQSGGEIYLSVTSGGESLKLKPGSYINIMIPKPSGPVYGMKLLGGVEDSIKGGVSWVVNNPVGMVIDTFSSFMCFLQKLDYKWINIDKPIDTSGSSYGFSANVNLPAINKGIFLQECFMVFKATNTVASVWFNNAGKAEVGKKIPAGTSVIMVCIIKEKKSGRFFYAKQTHIFNSDIHTKFDLVEMTEAEINDAIKLL
ncbi:MAG: hypothetical protein Q8M15_02650 [Bacteroidota bacterium]|nr:hypothetical protein [Bacteroidota bacterium]